MGKSDKDFLDSSCQKSNSPAFSNKDSGNLSNSSSTMSCPSIEAPCVIISDHSTNEPEKDVREKIIIDYSIDKLYRLFISFVCFSIEI